MDTERQIYLMIYCSDKERYVLTHLDPKKVSDNWFSIKNIRFDVNEYAWNAIKSNYGEFFVHPNGMKTPTKNKIKRIKLGYQHPTQHLHTFTYTPPEQEIQPALPRDELRNACIGNMHCRVLDLVNVATYLKGKEFYANAKEGGTKQLYILMEIYDSIANIMRANNIPVSDGCIDILTASDRLKKIHPTKLELLLPILEEVNNLRDELNNEYILK